ncbi:YjbF family lipoprotein (plasmid) [Thioclava litoralis]|uniref:YjbF family lipoprotein n=1 Tax=Thioclava litoralis TaxID=3076557 RepID=A0ABZ1E697_9RHOB|nr:YjbF family lipoprotein [Thioclava sp. FTW29]
MKFSALLPVVLLAALAACSGGVEVPKGEEVIGKSLMTALKQSRQPAPPQLSRAQLAQVGLPVMEVTPDRTGLTGYVTPATRQSDSLPGTVVTWQSSDKATFTFRNGVLIASRGLGFDLLSASAPIGAQGRMGPAHGGERHYVIRADDYSEIRLTLQCTLTAQPDETVEILGENHATRHLEERCTSPEGGRIVNDYWLGKADGALWQSRQWGGPRLGYVRFRQIIR